VADGTICRPTSTTPPSHLEAIEQVPGRRSLIGHKPVFVPKPPDMGTNRSLFRVGQPIARCSVFPVLSQKIGGKHVRHGRDRTQEVASSSLASSISKDPCICAWF
jgi:hypothetical protein